MPAARAAVARALAKSALYLSPVSAWEIGMLVRRGRLTLDLPIDGYVAKAFSRPGVRIAALTPEIAVRSCFLPGNFLSDPADQILAATAAALGLRLVTRDRRILDYGGQGFISVLAC